MKSSECTKWESRVKELLKDKQFMAMAEKLGILKVDKK